MIESLLSLPTFVGALVFMALTTTVGMAVYFVTFRLHSKRHSDDAMKEIGNATGNLFRVVGWLFTLLLSLTFTDVLSELAVTESSIQKEAAAIEDVFHNLRRFGTDEAQAAHNLLVEYTQAVVENDWPALARNKLSPRADALLRQLEDAVLELPATGPRQEILLSRIISDMDPISDLRLARLHQASENPPFVLIVVLFGYLITMVYFGIYQPRRALVSLLALYTVFVGVVVYLMLALGDPFQGAMAIDSEPLKYVLESMRRQ